MTENNFALIQARLHVLIATLERRRNEARWLRLIRLAASPAWRNRR